jgi:putative transposase
MTRLARVVAVDLPHHVTQRGNARQFLLTNDVERTVYLNLLRKSAEVRGLAVMGYCLMSNHVHLVVIPHRQDALALTLKQTHGRYASYWNASRQTSGHVWQGRYYSCPLDGEHLWQALRYTELNPVRAGLVADAEAWVWSSAGMHCGAPTESWLTMELWRLRWDAVRWRQYLSAGETEDERIAIRKSTYSGRPLGEKAFVEGLEETMQRRLAPGKRGRPKKTADQQEEGRLIFQE